MVVSHAFESLKQTIRQANQPAEAVRIVSRQVGRVSDAAASAINHELAEEAIHCDTTQLL